MQQRVVSTVKFQWMLCLLVSLWLSLWSTTPLFAQATDETGRIAGIVTNEEGVPLAGIQVHVYRYDPANQFFYPYIYIDPFGVPINLDISTDEAGAFQVAYLQPGEYTLHFIDAQHQYAFQFYGGSSKLSEATKITVDPGNTTTSVNTTLISGGIISGHITMYNSTPINEGTIAVYYHDGQEWRSIYNNTSINWENQTFLASGLATSAYRIEYSVLHNDNHFLGYYKNADSIDTANDIPVVAGQTTENVDIMVGANPQWGRIQGKITNSDGIPLYGIEVHGVTQGGMVIRYATTDHNGNYEIPPLPSQTYQLFFRDPSENYGLQFYREQVGESNTPDILVPPGTTVENINVQLQPGNRLTGEVRMWDGTPIPLSTENVILNLVYVDGMSRWHFAVDLGSLKHTDSQATNRYDIGGLALGRYELELFFDQLHTETITITNPGTTTHDLVVGNAKGQIQGIVVDEIGEPLAGIEVKLYRMNGNWQPELNASGSDNWATTDHNGHYQFQVNPGVYLLLFEDPNQIYAFEYYGDAAQIELGQPITITAGAIITADQIILSSGSQISGHIELFDGRPFGGNGWGAIFLAKYETQQWQLIRETVITTTSTPNFDITTGVYSFGGLAAGQYQIGFSHYHYDNGGELYEEFYDNVSFPQEPTTINLAVGGSIRIDVVLDILVKQIDNQRVLALYALALDHDPDRIDNLAPQLAPAMQSIIAATRDQPNKTAVVLADAAGVGDTRIYVVQNGRATPVQGLPNAAFQLDPTLTEANMADGATLGNFIRWARNTYPAEVTLFGFVGHGAPLVPATGFADIVAASGGIRPFGPTDLTTNLFPLPSRVDAYPSLTDNHPEALITPHDLAMALRIGSNNGADPLQIADIAHCFSASIEELYELSPDGDQPYAEIILASPTYTYLDPPALGQALGAINTLMTPARMADQILQTYDSLIEQADLSDGDADVEHPRLLVAVNSRQVARVKQDWDKVAYQLLQNFDGEKLRQAYLTSPKYDTTVCRPQDWMLGAPDALSDLYGFAAALVTVYGAESAVGQAAAQVVQDLEETAILSRYQRNGEPWYAPQGAQFWNFNTHKGIALYTDLQGTPTTEPATVELSWQSRWYTADPLGGENPQPFAFVQNGFNGATWAEVFAEFWHQQPAVTIKTALCFPELASEPAPGALRAAALLYPQPGTLRVGAPLALGATVETGGAALKPTVRFNVYDSARNLLFSDTVQAGYWLTGTHQIAPAHTYTPTTPGPLTVEVIVDPTNGFTEADESDNRIEQQYTVAPDVNRFPLTVAARLAQPALFVAADQVGLRVSVSAPDLASQLEVQLYQFADGSPTALRQPIVRGVQMLDLANPSVALGDLSPGVVLLSVRAVTLSGQTSERPAVIEFNYAPVHQPLAAGQSHLYRIPTGLSTALQLDLTAHAGSVDLFAWSPLNAWGPEWQLTAQGTDSLVLPATRLADAYLLEVYGTTDSIYSLTAQPTTAAPTAANVTHEGDGYWPAQRPRFIQPVDSVPGEGLLVTGYQTFLPQTYR